MLPRRARRVEANLICATGMLGASLTEAGSGKALSDRPALEPYRGKPAVRNLRGDDGNVGIIRSPIRAIVLPDPDLSRIGCGSAQPETNQVPRETRCPTGSEQTSTRSTCRQGRPEVAGKGRRAVVCAHSTGEGGEPQGSRTGRPRHPLEGRGKQVDASIECHIHETQNSRKYVK